MCVCTFISSVRIYQGVYLVSWLLFALGGPYRCPTFFIPFQSFLLGLSIGTPKPLIGCPQARQPPNALEVHLKRFAVQGGGLTKTKTQIGFGKPLAVKVSGPEDRAIYDLTGCVQLRRVMCRAATVGSQRYLFCRG